MNYHENKKDGNIDSGNRGDFKERYNGKELDSSNGLDTYDYLARMYDPSLGRFMSVDPLSEKYYSISPYVYCADNPVKHVDPDGRKITHYYQSWLGINQRNGDIFLQNRNMQNVKRAYQIFGQTKKGSSLISSFVSGRNSAYELMLVTGHYISDNQKKLAHVDTKLLGHSEIRFDSESNNLKFVVYVDDSSRSIGEILETIVHEFSDHMSESKIQKCINEFEKCGKGVKGYKKAKQKFNEVSPEIEHKQQINGFGEPGTLYNSYKNEIKIIHPEYQTFFK
ncbi:RHS repeat-associated core domain-containing protein [Segatella bryantii]|uniref:RHS repeat-associated core domain-containing protein n=1 Tax=Segatella bryantii TaxID=77095 RepID=UPI000894BE39|nr:RHS repeat-associated core domain-containing protein [Segatella bryantii]